MPAVIATNPTAITGFGADPASTSACATPAQSTARPGRGDERHARSSAPSSRAPAARRASGRRSSRTTTAPSSSADDVRARDRAHAEDARTASAGASPATRSRGTRRAARPRRRAATIVQPDAPAVVGRLRDRVDEQREPGRDRDGAGDVRRGLALRSGSRARTAARAGTRATPTGTLTKKIHSQPRYFVSTPPASTPTAAPEPPIAPQIPSALLRSAPSSKVVMMIESAAGEMIAAPRPCTARAAISTPSDQARPQRSDAIVKTTTPTRKTRRRPKRSAARPPSSRKPPNVIA